MAINTAITLGRKAKTKKTIPTHTATRHDATPDCSTNGALDGAVPVGIVPARPHSRLLTPTVATAPWTERRSVARCRRHETRWVETAWPRVPVVPINMTSTKAGRRDQKAGPNVRSTPGQAFRGKPIQGAAAIGSGSYRPNDAATAQPTVIPIRGAHNRHRSEARNRSATTVAKVTAALVGAAAHGVPSGTVVSIRKIAGMMETAIRTRSVPVTIGVMKRRNKDRRVANANCNPAETSSRVAIRDGPPAPSALMHTPMKALLVTITSG